MGLRFLVTMALALALSNGVLFAQPAGWKAMVDVGALYSTNSSEGSPSSWEPRLSLGWFREAVAMTRPEFYDLGGRLEWSEQTWTLLAGTRHKLYVIQDSNFAQEVLLGLRLKNSVVQTAVVAGRFGGSYSLASQTTPYPTGSIDAALIWQFGWNWVSGQLDAQIGGSFGLGGSFF